MAQETLSAEPPKTPPPIPLRSHLRNGLAYQLKLCAINSGISSMANTPSSPASQILLEEIDHELADTRQRFHSAIIERQGMHSQEDLDHCEGQGNSDGGSQNMTHDSGREDRPGELHASASGSEVGYSNDHLDSLHPLRLMKHPERFNQNDHRGSEDCVKGAVEDVKVLGHTTTQQGSHASMAQTVGLGITEDCSPSYQYSGGATDTKFVDWLAQGFLSPSLPEADSSKLDSKRSSRPFPPRHLALSLFPPESPSTGNREYTPPGSPFARPICPMSPLNNGRDVYGNYIASNARDYFTAQSTPTSPDPQPANKEQDHSTSGELSPAVCLRGGGWGKFKPFWKTASTEMSNQTPRPTPLHKVVSKDDVPQEVPTVTYVRRPDREAPSSARSQFSGPRARTNPRTTNARGELSAVDIRRYGVHGLDERPGTMESADMYESSLRRADVDAILTNYFGLQPPRSPLVSSENRSSAASKQEIAYDSYGLPIRGGTSLPPVDNTSPPHNARRQFVSSNVRYSNYDNNSRQLLASRRSTSWDTANYRKTPETDGAVRSHKGAPRDEKRWHRDAPPPPRLPPVQPLKYIQSEPSDDATSYSEDGSCRVPSITSINTVDDRFTDLPGLKSSDAYRKVQLDREVRRIEEQRRLHVEADRRREEVWIREQEAQKQGLPQGSILSGDALIQAMRLGSSERPLELDRVSASDEQHHHNSPAPSQYLPRHGPIPASFRRPEKPVRHHDTIGYPWTVTATDSTTPPTASKHHTSLRNVLSKAGKLSRRILAAPSEPILNTYLQRHPYINPKKSGMSADSSGWPSIGASTSREGFPRSMRVREEGDRLEMKRMKRTDRALEEAQASETVVRDFATKNFQEMSLLGEPAVSTNTASPGYTPPQYLGYPQNGPRARPQRPGISTPVVGSHTVPIPSAITNQSPLGRVAPCDAAGKPLPAFPDQPDINGCLYIRRDDGEVLPFNPSLGYPYHLRLNNAYGVVRPDRITEEWLDGIVPSRDATGQPTLGMRGGASEESPPLSPLLDSEANTFTDHYCLLNPGALDTFFSSSSVNLSFESAAQQALLPAEPTNEDVVRSSFSTDSTLEIRREKKEKEKAWRNEDDTRAMAWMHSFG